MRSRHEKTVPTDAIYLDHYIVRLELFDLRNMILHRLLVQLKPQMDLLEDLLLHFHVFLALAC